MMIPRLAAIAALPFVLAACAATPDVPPAPISAEQFALYGISEIEIDAADAVVVWPAQERAFASSRGVSLPNAVGAGGPDADVSDEDRVQVASYEALLASEDAKSHLRAQAAAAMKPSLDTALRPAFTGEKPMKVAVDLDAFVVRSSGAVALGGQEGANGTVTFTDATDDTVIATLPDVAVATRPATAGYGGGGLLGIAVSLAVVAAVNAASDAASVSHIKIADGYAQRVRSELQLPEADGS